MKEMTFGTVKKIFSIIQTVILCSAATIWAQGTTEQSFDFDTSGGSVTFSFKYSKGDTYRILSTVEEDIYVNRQFDHHSTIINRIAAEVIDDSGSSGYTLKESYMTSENATGQTAEDTFTWGEEYESQYFLDEQGNYTIDPQYFIPQVRNVPVFPKSPLSPGDSWQADGQEAHDLRQNFKIQEPYLVPFTANYTYLGSTKTSASGSNGNEKTLQVFSVKYSTYMKSPEMKASMQYYSEYPVLMMGYSDELIYFDTEKGAIDHYTESFRIVMETSYGTTYEYRGTAHSEMTDIVQMNTRENVDSLQQKVQELGIEDVTVTQGEKGLTISLENIQFKPDSAVLLDSEKIKLQKIAEILKTIPENDILVIGHTALAGTAKSRQTLSEQRAKTVAAYLILLGVRDRSHIFTQGMGAKQPVADNSTEEGKAKNRRVEIIILEK